MSVELDGNIEMKTADISQFLLESPNRNNDSIGNFLVLDVEKNEDDIDKDSKEILLQNMVTALLEERYKDENFREDIEKKLEALETENNRLNELYLQEKERNEEMKDFDNVDNIEDLLAKNEQIAELYDINSDLQAQVKEHLCRLNEIEHKHQEEMSELLSHINEEKLKKKHIQSVLEEQMDLKQRQIEELVDHSKELENVVVDLKKQIKEDQEYHKTHINEMVAEFNQKFLKLQEKNNVLNQANKSLRDKDLEREQQYSNLLQENRIKIQTLEAHLSDFQSVNVANTGSNSLFKVSDTDFTRQCEQLNSQIKIISTELKDVKLTNRNLEDLKLDLLGKNEEMNTELKKFKHENSELNGELFEKVKLIGDFEEKIKTYEQQLEILEEKLKESEGKLLEFETVAIANKEKDLLIEEYKDEIEGITFEKQELLCKINSLEDMSKDNTVEMENIEKASMKEIEELVNKHQLSMGEKEDEINLLREELNETMNCKKDLSALNDEYTKLQNKYVEIKELYEELKCTHDNYQANACEKAKIREIEFKNLNSMFEELNIQYNELVESTKAPKCEDMNMDSNQLYESDADSFIDMSEAESSISEQDIYDLEHLEEEEEKDSTDDDSDFEEEEEDWKQQFNSLKEEYYELTCSLQEKDEYIDELKRDIAEMQAKSKELLGSEQKSVEDLTISLGHAIYESEVTKSKVVHLEHIIDSLLVTSKGVECTKANFNNRKLVQRFVWIDLPTERLCWSKSNSITPNKCSSVKIDSITELTLSGNSETFCVLTPSQKITKLSFSAFFKDRSVDFVVPNPEGIIGFIQTLLFFNSQIKFEFDSKFERLMEYFAE
eukprot:TRINITY_DN2311_c0_g1_i1.p1 TRINITY_DN2311_c0_g1~~TRINITY_DN2311_c0_g1_i1.p1  ORF type:complete len:838 (+),score=314.35 TRINITY_DN2311_c0_g1_i1:1589-4102(+)